MIYKDECYAIQGAIYTVHNEMGSGFLEAVYQECLRLEFMDRDIPFQEKVGLKLKFKYHQLSQNYIPDFICYNKIIIEIKAATELLNIHRAQSLNYLKATGNKLCLPVNFHEHPKVKIERIVL